MGKIVKALKSLGVAVNGVEPAGRYISDVLNSIANAYKGVAVLEVADVKALTTAQCNALKAGDVVIKNESGSKHTYTVSYKQADEMCITYCDHQNVEEVYYEKSGANWSFIQIDNTHIGQ